MRILFITHSFNSLAQRLFLELTRRGHEVAIEFDIHDAVTVEAVELFQPDLVIAPYLKRAIPEAVWKKHVCLIVHPGIRGDRGPSSLDWALLTGEKEWGVTILQANAEMDAGDIWAEARFPMRLAPKSSLYRQEVTEAAVDAVLLAVERFETDTFKPEPLNPSDPSVKGVLRPLMRQEDRAIHWDHDDSETVLRKIHGADGSPGVLDQLFGEDVYLYRAVRDRHHQGAPGEILGWSDFGVLRATLNDSVWIGYVRSKKPNGEKGLKLPAIQVLEEHLSSVPKREGPHEIRFEERNGVGYLHFDFHNGAMSTSQCERLREAVQDAVTSGIRVLALMGGEDFWSNGIHLNAIEASGSPADESWRNIEAMNDLALSILTATDVVTISALQGNAGAGGVFLALASDHVFARSGVVLNPHYKGMGNLYGSEYWTYSLPRRVGEENAKKITDARLPLGAPEAWSLGLLDDHFGRTPAEFRAELERRAETIATDLDEFEVRIRRKTQRREEDEARRTLAAHREAEMAQMRLNFYGFDPSYHVARFNFVHRVPHSRTPRHLAKHRYK